MVLQNSTSLNDPLHLREIIKEFGTDVTLPDIPAFPVPPEVPPIPEFDVPEDWVLVGQCNVGEKMYVPSECNELGSSDGSWNARELFVADENVSFSEPSDIRINNKNYVYLAQGNNAIYIPPNRYFHHFSYDAQGYIFAKAFSEGTYLSTATCNILIYTYESIITDDVGDVDFVGLQDFNVINTKNGLPSITLTVSPSDVTIGTENAICALSSARDNDFSGITPTYSLVSNPESNVSISGSTLSVDGDNRNKAYIVTVRAINGYLQLSNSVNIAVKEYPPPPVWSSIDSITGTVEQNEDKVWESVDLRGRVSNYTSISEDLLKTISPAASYNSSTGKVTFTTFAGQTVTGTITVRATNSNTTTGLSQTADATFSVNVTHNAPVVLGIIQFTNPHTLVSSNYDLAVGKLQRTFDLSGNAGLIEIGYTKLYSRNRTDTSHYVFRTHLWVPPNQIFRYANTSNQDGPQITDNNDHYYANINGGSTGTTLSNATLVAKAKFEGRFSLGYSGDFSHQRSA